VQQNHRWVFSKHNTVLSLSQALDNSKSRERDVRVTEREACAAASSLFRGIPPPPLIAAEHFMNSFYFSRSYKSVQVCSAARKISFVSRAHMHISFSLSLLLD
jgi:hypothetical protein